MNRLVGVLQQRREVIDQISNRAVVTFELLMDVLGEEAMFGGNEWKFEHELSDRLFGSYLPVVAVRDWESAVSAAVTDIYGWEGWRTVLLNGMNEESGLTAPHEYSSHEVVALFTGPEEDARILVCDTAQRRMQLTRAEERCPELTRGRCGRGGCECEVRKMWDKASHGVALTCLCSDKR